MSENNAGKVSISTIKIQTKEQEFVISLDEAKQIWEELGKLFGKPETKIIYREKKTEPLNPLPFFPLPPQKWPDHSPEYPKTSPKPALPYNDQWTCMTRTADIQISVQ